MNKRIEKHLAMRKPGDRATMWAFQKAIGWYYALGVCMILIRAFTTLFAPAYLIKNLINFLSQDSAARDPLTGWLLVLGFFLNSSLQSISANRAAFYTYTAGLRVRSPLRLPFFPSSSHNSLFFFLLCVPDYYARRVRPS